jgi:putative serine protease PepD
MSGQPRDDDAVDRHGQPDQSGNPGDLGGGSARPDPGADGTPEPERIADFEAFNRFAKAADVDERTLAGRARRDSWRRKSGALLPGAWAKPVGAGPAAGQAGASDDPGGASGVGAAGGSAPSTSDGDPADGATGGESSGKRQRFMKLPDWRLLRRSRASGAATSGPGPGPGASSPAVPGPGASSPAFPGPVVSGPGASSQAAAVPPGDSRDSTAGQEGAGQNGATQDGAGQASASRDRRVGKPAGLWGGRLALAAGGLALTCTMLGGVIGGYIALHTAAAPTTNPSYSLGTVPPALNNRPASSVAGIAARVTPSVVMIKVNGGIGTGSGFIISGDYIVTDNHVVTLDGELNNAALRVYFSNGQSAPGELVGRDPYSDIAVIRAEGVTGLPALSLGNSTGVDVGDPVIAVGSPLGLADTVTSGIVSAVNRPVQPGQTGSSPQVYFDAIQTDAPINPGNSGGPLVNGRGQVIGVDAAIDTLGNNPLTGTQGGSIGLGFAIPINQARRVALELIRTGYATHAVIGAQIAIGWGGNGAEIMPAKAGGTSTVTPGGPAAMAGLQPGDVIIRFDGQAINNADTLLDAIRSLAPGTTTSLTFTQAGQPHTATIQLGSAPS